MPSFRHWFSGAALAGAVLAAVNVLLGVIGIAPVTTAGVKWGFLGVGMFFSLVLWYSLAAANRDKARAEQEARDADNKRLAEIKELPQRVLEAQDGITKELANYKALLSATETDKEKLEESRQHLRNWLDYMFPMFNTAVENDILGSDTVGDIQRVVSDPNLSLQTRMAAVTHEVWEYHKNRKINGHLSNSTVTLSGGTVSLDIPDVTP
jgi:hypothetical protein